MDFSPLESGELLPDMSQRMWQPFASVSVVQIEAEIAAQPLERRDVLEHDPTLSPCDPTGTCPLGEDPRYRAQTDAETVGQILLTQCQSNTNAAFDGLTK